MHCVDEVAESYGSRLASCKERDVGNHILEGLNRHESGPNDGDDFARSAVAVMDQLTSVVEAYSQVSGKVSSPGTDG